MPDIFAPIEEPSAISAFTASLPKARANPLTAFCLHPYNITFQTQEPDEEILLFLRKHFVTNIPWIFTTIILSSIPILIAFLIQIGLANVLLFSLPSQFIFIVLLFYYLMVFAFAFVSFITWFYNISLVTTKRVVDIDYADIVYRNVSVTKLNLIEEVNLTQSGFIRSFFNYGDVFIKTIANTEDFDFLAVPNPTRVVEIIQNLIGGPR